MAFFVCLALLSTIGAVYIPNYCNRIWKRPHLKTYKPHRFQINYFQMGSMLAKHRSRKEKTQSLSLSLQFFTNTARDLKVFLNLSKLNWPMSIDNMKYLRVAKDIPNRVVSNTQRPRFTLREYLFLDHRFTFHIQ